MKTVEVSQSALESLQKMVEQLQGERDELLEVVGNALSLEASRWLFHNDALYNRAHKIYSKCTAKPEVLE